MRALRSNVALVSALVLLVPVVVDGQDPPDVNLAVSDATGDIYDLANEEPSDGPPYMDITRLELDADDMFLWLTMHTAGAIPSAVDPLYMTVGWYLQVDADSDGEVDRWVSLDPLDGWSASVFDIATMEDTRFGVPTVNDNTIAARIPWPLLGDPETLRFQGLVQGTHFPDPLNDPLNWMDWEDRVPDGEDGWLALGESPVEVGTEESGRPPLRDLSVLLEVRQPKAEFADVRAEFFAYLDSHPDTLTAARLAEPEFEREWWWDRCEPELKKGRFAPTGYCAGGFQDLVIAYADTRDDGLYDLLGAYIGATLHEFKKGRQRTLYREALEKTLKSFPRDYPDLFADE